MAKKNAATSHLIQATDAKQPTEAQTAQVVDWFLKGVNGGSDEATIVAAIRQRFPEIDPKLMLMGAFRHFQDIAKVNSQAMQATYGWCIASSREVYRLMLEAEDYNGALKAIKQIKDLFQEASGIIQNECLPPER